jgi:hypothetical protein
MRRGMLDRLEKLDGSKHPKAIVLATLLGGDDDQAESNGFLILTGEEWERKFCIPEPKCGANGSDNRDKEA